jgi:uncharacterized protein
MMPALHGDAPGAHRVAAGGHELMLLPQRGAYLPSERALLVADVHLGKAATFRSLGVPVPAGTTEATLARLSGLIDALQPRSLYVLGDLLHGPPAQSAPAVDLLARWRDRHHRVRVVLVRGNHDASAGDPPPRCGIDVVDEPHPLDDLLLCHEPRARPGNYVLAGHLHPAYRVTGRADSIRLPCFWIRARYAVLPAFGEFTGGASIAVNDGDQVFVTDGERVHPVRRRRGECF